MVHVFNLEELQNLLGDFYRITNIRITVFDSELNELVSYPERCAEFCALIRETEHGRAACARCDREGCAAAARQGRMQIYRCHAGLTEAVAPLYVGKVLVGYLIFGHVFAYGSFEEGWAEVSRSCAGYPLDMEELKRCCAQCPSVSKEYIKSAARILQATASYLVLERMATLREDSAAARLDAWLSGHYTESITAQLLCSTLNIGRSRLYKLSAQLYGCGVSQQITRLRMERARKLLVDCPDMSIAAIASECGYQDYNYFIAVFSRSFGQSPGAFRRGQK